MGYDINEFDKFYMEKVYPTMGYLELYRQKELSKYNSMKYFCIGLGVLVPIIMVIAFLYFIKATTDTASVLFALIFIFMVIPLACLCSVIASSIFAKYQIKAAKDFKRNIKKQCLTNIISFFENLKYKEQEIPEGLLKESGLFAEFNYLRRDDVFSGKYKDIWFQAEEVFMSNPLGGHKQVFRGIVIVFPTNKTVKAQTIIASKHDKNINNLHPYAIPTICILVSFLIFSMIVIYNFNQLSNNYNDIFKFILLALFAVFGIVYISVDTITKSKKYEGVKLEDIGFDSRFSVYSKDQIEARYLVTTTFMDRLQELETTFGTKNIKCSFFGNKIMFAISTDKDVFEFGNLFTPLTDSSQIHQFMDELTSIYNLIDYFKLAERTGL